MILIQKVRRFYENIRTDISLTFCCSERIEAKSVLHLIVVHIFNVPKVNIEILFIYLISLFLLEHIMKLSLLYFHVTK